MASTSSPTYKLLRQHFGDVVAVEMEGLGVLRAGHANADVRILVVRGISDMIDDKADADAHGSQELASAHAAAFAFEVLAHATPTEKTKSRVVGSGSVGDDSDNWRRLELIAVQLYPKGPDENEIWTRAGGDISLLNLNLIGKASWHSALQKLKLGGGGRDISARSLLSEMLTDFPKNQLILALAESPLADERLSQPSPNQNNG